ncbi:MAG: DNA-processing protein DprA [Candidatus Spechtbacterales bacterium]
MKKIKELKITDKEYPSILKEIPNPPELLYYRGNLEALKSGAMVAVVGTRRCSDYGKRATEEIAGGLAKAGVTIVSGLAKGIDTYGHKAALENKATTVAVLGTGVDDASIYPQRNKNLAHKIIESGGLVISEYEPGTPGYRANFPQRNRIVAGLVQGVLAVEAPLKSGTMITVRLAKDYKKSIYAVPGSIFSRLSEGCNALLTKGAKCVLRAEDILEDLEVNHKIIFEKNTQDTSILNDNEKKVLMLIADSPEPIHVDKIIQTSKLGAIDLAEILTSLVLQDFIKEAEANHYIASR